MLSLKWKPQIIEAPDSLLVENFQNHLKLQLDHQRV